MRYCSNLSQVARYGTSLTRTLSSPACSRCYTVKQAEHSCHTAAVNGMLLQGVAVPPGEHRLARRSRRGCCNCRPSSCSSSPLCRGWHLCAGWQCTLALERWPSLQASAGMGGGQRSESGGCTRALSLHRACQHARLGRGAAFGTAATGKPPLQQPTSHQRPGLSKMPRPTHLQRTRPSMCGTLPTITRLHTLHACRTTTQTQHGIARSPQN